MIKKEAEERLKKLIFPVHDELNETMEKNFSEADMEKMAEEFLERLFINFKSRLRNSSTAEKPSKMTAKIDRWQQFSDDHFQNNGKRTTKNNDYTQMVLPFLQEEDMEDVKFHGRIIC